MNLSRMRKDSAAPGKRQRLLAAMKQFLIAPLFGACACGPTPAGIPSDSVTRRS
jgi:hypothetical protein